MCIGGPSPPTPPPPPPPAPPPPQAPDQAVQQAGNDQRSKAIAALGPAATILTSAQGLTAPATTTAKTLTGS